MSRSRNRGGRRLRVALASAIAAFAAGAVGVSSASAATILLDHGFLKISGLEAPQEVITPANAIQLKDVTIGGGGAFTVDANPDINEIQRIADTPPVSGGTFMITFNTQTTAPIPFNAPLRNGINAPLGAPDDLAEALGDLSNLGYFDISLSGGPLPASDVVLEFVGGPVHGANQPEITIDSTGLTGGGSLNPSTDVQGASTSDFDFPQFEGTASGVPLAVDVEPNALVNGNFNTTTGVLTTSSVSYTATVALGPPVNATCSLTPIPLDFSTEKQEIFFGDRFDAAALPVNGAILDGWPTLPSDPAPACALVNGLTAGPGALWLSNGIATPTLVPVPPAPAAPVTTPKKCKKGQKLVKGKCKKKKKKKKK